MARVFRRTPASSPVSPAPSPPVPNNTPLQTTPPSLPYHNHSPGNARSPLLQPSPPAAGAGAATRMLAGSATATAAAAAGGTRGGGFPLRAKTSISALAAKTNGLVGAAAGFINKSTSGGLSWDERRRQRLKSSIRVMGDGGQFFGDGSDSGSGSAASVGSGAGLRGVSPRGSPGPQPTQVDSPQRRVKNSGPSPTPSGEMGQGYQVRGEGLGVGLGVI
jgi:hypothetical protein